LLSLSRWIDRFTEIVGTITYWLVPIVVAVGVWNVANRYVGRAIGRTLGSNVFIEAQWYIFSVIFFLGGAYALKHGEHVRVDLFYSNWEPRRKALADLVGTLFYLMPFCLLLIYFSWPTVEQSWRIREVSPDPSGLPRYPLKTFLLISPALLFIQGISEAIKNYAVYTGYADPSLVAEEQKHIAPQ
jgi:TRAP-type mannitol/chloroaromatic compound transport system permease small subunit